MKRFYRSRRKKWEFSLMPRQILLAMKLMVLFLIVASVGVTARSFSQTITWSGKNVPLERVFSDIEQQTGYSFFYNDEDMAKSRPVTLSLKNADLKSALSKIFQNQSLTYSLVGKTIFIHASSGGGVIGLSPSDEVQQSVLVHGVVTDAVTKHPLIGVTVQIKGTSTGVTTDDNGEFNLSAPDNAILIFSYVGYSSQEISLNGRLEINVMMQANVSSLNQLVVVGYGSEKRKDLIGALSVVNTNNVKDMPVGGIDQLLQGKVAGMAVTEATGAPGSPIEIRIRGIGTIGNNDPLYIVDGVPTKDGINEISPNDVESITILKDAASASIYGARSSNGVVLITTKRGKSGPAKFSLNAYIGWQTPGHLIKMANTDQYIKAYNAAALADGRTQIPSGMLDTLPNVNWLKAILKPTPISNIQLSVSGGGERATYLVSASYFNQEGMILNSSDKRATVHSAITAELSKFFKIGSNINLTYNKIGEVGSSGDGYGAGNPGASVVRYALFRTPATPIFDKSGNYVDLPSPPSFFGDGYNPVGLAVNTNRNFYNYSLLGDIYLTLTPLKNLSIKSDLGTNMILTEYKEFFPTWGTRNINATGSLAQSFTNNFNYNWTNTATYNWLKNKSELNIVGGTELIYNDIRAMSASQQNYPNQTPAFQYLDNGVGTSINPYGSVGGNELRSALFSLFGKANYQYDNKYLASLSFRRDGSSRLQASDRFGDFFSGGVGWRIDRESFMQNIKPISLLKIRADIGQLGNQEIGNYAYTSTIGPMGSYSFDGAQVPGYSIVSLGNPNIKWETSTQKDIGLNLGLWDNSFLVSVDYYNKTTNNMLLPVPVPSSAGQEESPTENAGKVLNTGFEFELNYNKEVNHNLSFEIDANLATVKNRVVSLAGGKPIPAGRIDDNIYATLTTVGEPIGEFYLYQMEGIFQTPVQILTHAYQGPNTAPGDVRYKDINHDGVIDENDRVFAGSPIPKFTYGLTGNIRYSHFDLSLFFQGVYGNKIYNQVLTDIEGFYRPFNITERIATQSWHGEGTSNQFPRLSWSGAQNNKQPSTRFLENGSYMRLKNVQLGYTFDSKALEKIKINSARIYISAQNVFTITQYTGLDPEMGISANAATAGDGVKAVGIDWGTYPSARVITLGINLNL